MNNKHHFIKRILALFLLGVLLLPSSLDVIHHCEIHVHFECNKQKAHLHQSEINCEICDFNLINFNYELVNRENLKQLQIFVALNAFYNPDQFYLFTHNSKQLRAPPVMS